MLQSWWGEEWKRKLPQQLWKWIAFLFPPFQREVRELSAISSCYWAGRRETEREEALGLSVMEYHDNGYTRCFFNFILFYFASRKGAKKKLSLKSAPERLLIYHFSLGAEPSSGAGLTRLRWEPDESFLVIVTEATWSVWSCRVSALNSGWKLNFEVIKWCTRFLDMWS